MKQAIEIQEGETIDVILTSNVSVGDIVPLGTKMIGVAVTSGLIGEQIALKTEGVWQVNAKTADVIAVGTVLYFDATNNELTKTATANTLAGKAVSTKAAVAGTVNIKINI